MTEAGEWLNRIVRGVQASPDAYLPHALGMIALFFIVLILALHGRYRRQMARLGEDMAEQVLEASQLRIRLEERDARVAELQKRTALLERNLQEAGEGRAALAAELASAEKARAEQLALVENGEARLREAFGALSREALGRNNEMFISLAKAQLGEFNLGAQADLEAKRLAVDSLIKPIGEALGRMDAVLGETEKSRREDYARLATSHRTLAETTDRLVRALHHSSARGRWGELQLRRVVELAGMLEHCDFEEQMSVDDDGRRLRPDLVINLVGGRTIVVDAKAPMESYLKAHEAGDENAEKELRQRHARAVKNHMQELGHKSYWSQFDDTPEFVVMFFPNEAVFAEALRVDPGLMEFGVVNQVIPASPATLIALLKAAAYGWQQERAAANAREIFKMGRELYDRFSVAYRHFSGVGASLAKAVDHYNKCVGSSEKKLFPALRRFTDKTEQEMFPAPPVLESTPRELTAGEGKADVSESIQSGAAVDTANASKETA